MLPAFLLTVSTPSETIHWAGDLSCAETHWSRFLPSNKMIASEGAAPQVAPGVTTSGTGFHTSVSSGFARSGVEGACCTSLDTTSTANERGMRNRVRTHLPMEVEMCRSRETI